MLATKSYWSGKRELVEVWFDPERVTYAELAAHVGGLDAGGWFAVPCDADQREVAQRVFEAEYADLERPAMKPDAEPKYYLFKTDLRHVPMTEAQAVLINARVRAQQAYEELLSPRQRALLAEIRASAADDWPVVVGVEPGPAWQRVRAARGY